MSSSDVVGVLLTQHHEIQLLCDAVDRAPGPDKKRLFARLARLVSLHELGEQRIVHPAARNSSPEGDRVGVACLVEAGNIERAIQELQVLGDGDGAFDGLFTELCHAIAEHAAHEERDEFPILRRYVPASRLHMMAGAVHDVQVMAAN
jgi:hypothetical protein